MKVLYLAIATSLTGLLLAGNAFAQYGFDKSSVRRTAYAYDSYYADEDDVASPSDAPTPMADTQSSNGEAADSGCDACAQTAASCGCEADGCDTCGCQSNDCCRCSRLSCGRDCLEDCGQPWTLQRCENSIGLTYGGWISAGFTANSHGNTTSDGNLPLGWNNDTAFNLHQLWGYIDREADTGGCGFDWGFHLDFVFGVDGPDTQAFGDIGWDNDWDSGGEYGSALPQLYAVLAWNDLSIKLGHFYTIIGYEVVQAPDNFFYSHSYCQYYAEPFTHTGFIADYAVNDQWAVSLGYVQGWDSGFNNKNDANMVIGGISWSSCDENTSLAYAVTGGTFGDDPSPIGSNEGNLYMHSLVFSQAFGCGWTYVLQWDLGLNWLATAPDTEWYGINQYLLKEINCCWAVGGRFEWFRDDDGVRVGTGTAVDGNYYALTLGANWMPHTNLRFRPEVRYDWFDGVGLPMDNGTEDTQLTFGIDGIFTF
jgi:hypothetical protein